MDDALAPLIIALTASQTWQLAQEASEGYPNEICGFLIGVSSVKEKVISHLLPIVNDWESDGASFRDVGADFITGTRRRRFAIPPDEFYRADKAARAKGEDILGFYHSHPDSPAIPSEYDLRLAQEIFPGYSYVIIAVPGGAPAEITAWALTEDAMAFRAETIMLVENNLVENNEEDKDTGTDTTFTEGVDRILWEIWDPIGVNDTPEARDEYASYVPAITVLLRQNASDAEFLAFLQTTERETMGLRGSNKEHLMAVIAHLHRFAEGE